MRADRIFSSLRGPERRSKSETAAAELALSSFAILCFLFLVLCSPFSAYTEIAEGIMAIVNDEVITRYDLEGYLAPLYFQYKTEYQGKELEEKIKQLERDGLQRLIEEKLLLSEAKKRKINIENKEIKARLEEVKLRFSSEEEFYDALSGQDLTEEDLEERYRDQMIIQRLVDEEVRYRATVSPSEIEQYYSRHIQEFNVPERVKLRNILIRAETEEKEEEAFIRARELATMLKMGKSFEELAKQYSEGPNAEEGGVMGLVGQGDLSKELEAEVFKLQAGQISEVIKSPLGYHLFKVEERIPAQVKPLREAQEEIRQRLWQQKLESQYKGFIGTLRAKAYIAIK